MCWLAARAGHRQWRLTANDARWYACGDGAVRDVREHDGVRADYGTVTDPDFAEKLCPSSDDYVVHHNRELLRDVYPSGVSHAERYLLKHRATFSDHRFLANNNAIWMRYENTFANLASYAEVRACETKIERMNDPRKNPQPSTQESPLDSQ